MRHKWLEAACLVQISRGAFQGDNCPKADTCLASGGQEKAQMWSKEENGDKGGMVGEPKRKSSKTF